MSTLPPIRGQKDINCDIKVLIGSECVCELTLSDNILNNVDGLVKLSNLNLHWIGPHFGLLKDTRGQRSDHKALRLRSELCSGLFLPDVHLNQTA